MNFEVIDEKISGIVNRVTFHSHDSGWSVLKVSIFNSSNELSTVTVHQCKVFAGATMDFFGKWTVHQKFGRQFKATKAVERKPASAAALEKYLGSGLIKGVGPKTARRIVKYFGGDTLSVFENNIDRLIEVDGIARRKLQQISERWEEHREIRNVMIFLQTHGISTLFAVKIFKKYGKRAVYLVKENPYKLAKDFYGIGFFSADKIALSVGVAFDSEQRIGAAIKHVLAASRDEGHCYLSLLQISEEVCQLLNFDCSKIIPVVLETMEKERELCIRIVEEKCFYSNKLFYDENFVAKKIMELVNGRIKVDAKRVELFVERYCQRNDIMLSDQQRESVLNVSNYGFSILTGGPGCGKTTTTRVIVALFMAMNKRVTITAPTGRAAQRMGEVIGVSAKTIHRLLVWNPATGGFKKGEDDPLDSDVLIVDETSMLDISLTADLLRATKSSCQVVFIGDMDQLPSVGAGNVLKDIIESNAVPCFRLTKIFRQAGNSQIVKYAHEINGGEIPKIDSPINRPELWKSGIDCLFIDSNEATKEQIRFICKVKSHFGAENLSVDTDQLIDDIESDDFVIPEKFMHVNLQALFDSPDETSSLREVLKQVHPWSTLHYGLGASDMVSKLYIESIPKYLGNEIEIQILAPMIRGSVGTYNLNKNIQMKHNPPASGKRQLIFGEKTLRIGDRVIQRRNNYDLEVFNGDIGKIVEVDTEEISLIVRFKDGKSFRKVVYNREAIAELDLAYAITIHKSQGSEFDVIIIPVLSQHYRMLFRNLMYTGLTRARKMAIFVGTRKAFAMSIKNNDSRVRQTALKELLQS